MSEAHAPPKHPYHLVAPSIWPLVGAIAAGLITTGGVLYMHGYGWTLLIIGAIAVLATMAVWWRDVIREATFQGYHTPVVQLGMPSRSVRSDSPESRTNGAVRRTSATSRPFASSETLAADPRTNCCSKTVPLRVEPRATATVRRSSRALRARPTPWLPAPRAGFTTIG